MSQPAVARPAAATLLTFLVSLRLISCRSSRRSSSFLAAERRDIPSVRAAVTGLFGGAKVPVEPDQASLMVWCLLSLTLKDVPLLQLVCRRPLAQPPEETERC